MSRLRRRIAVVLTLTGLAGPALSQGKPKQAKQQKPNLLVITFDTTRADRLPPYGFTQIKTPTIERLAREGTVFLHTASQSPQTLPSHTSLFTGLYTITHNVRSNGQKLEDNAITLAEVLSAEGYQTGAVVATAALLKAFNLNQGFKSYDDDFEDPAVSKAFKTVFRFFSRHKVNLYSTRSANRVSTLGKKWLQRAASKKRPFFLWLHFFDPHSPYEFHPDFSRPNWVVSSGEKNEYGQLEKNYLNEIEFADYYLGKVLDQLDALGLSQNTLVVFTADHGESLGEHEYTGHRGEVYENIVHVPLIMRFPGRVPDGRRSHVPAMSIDVAPTTLSLLGIEYPKKAFAGKNLFQLDPEAPRKRYSLAVKLFTKDPIRTALYYEDRKFIRFDDARRNQWFDLSKDPTEHDNLLSNGLSPQLPNKALSSKDIDWLQEIAEWFGRFEELTVSDFEMSPEQMERLRSLGYIQD